MPRMTLLEMTQDILSAMDSDEVNSISDTVESMQVAQNIKSTYEFLVPKLNLPEKMSMARLDSLGDINRPNYLRIPSNVDRIHWLKYDNNELTYVTPEEFAFRLFGSDTGTTVTDPSGIQYKVDNTQIPTLWTTFDDLHIAFDSWNASAESTVQSSKSLVWAAVSDVFEMVDEFTPRLDPDLFPMLLAEAKASCFVNHKQVSNSKEEKKARDALVGAQNGLWRAGQRTPGSRGPNYGRRR